ncbi:hypothetical protein Cob_v003507 [Colletotrichum orbiculare MAFF 240422]|uniref:Uncharacterized protein n=1 Tax=Colletotrichum orbiculare (strain 104-T / ATCC 96160 / CBS 514.97 / LARS 414 / MAFF 240422) TaxID=1213857 RepID=N4VY33_COLOR|nr:hypothetical protein Cob_v003507 [Colletotrichum orbiculare MAFF 240422]
MTKTAHLEDLIITDRGGIVENRHAVHAAVVDSAGRLLYAVGNPRRVTLARSAAKPAQALAVLETPGFERFGFTEADLGLACASHSSEARHAERARSMLAKVGARESHLRCGGHPSICPSVDKGWVRAGFEPTPVYNNCSGKHAAMLGGALSLAGGFEDYHLPGHPMQAKVKQVVAELSGLGEAEVEWAIDGCNLPAPGMPLDSMARMYASFASAADIVARDDDASSATERTQRMARVFRAMAEHPEMVGGQGRFCTLLMEAFGGRLFGKVGADGCYAVGVRESDDTRRLGCRGPLGIAVKIDDGSSEMLYAAVPEILEQLGVGGPDTRRRLEHFHHPRRVNTMGVQTGRVTAAFTVREVDSRP